MQPYLAYFVVSVGLFLWTFLAQVSRGAFYYYVGDKLDLTG